MNFNNKNSPEKSKFDLKCFNSKLPKYNSLTDKYLIPYF